MDISDCTTLAQMETLYTDWMKRLPQELQNLSADEAYTEISSLPENENTPSLDPYPVMNDEYRWLRRFSIHWDKVEDLERARHQLDDWNTEAIAHNQKPSPTDTSAKAREIAEFYSLGIKYDDKQYPIFIITTALPGE